MIKKGRIVECSHHIVMTRATQVKKYNLSTNVKYTA